MSGVSGGGQCLISSLFFGILLDRCLELSCLLLCRSIRITISYCMSIIEINKQTNKGLSAGKWPPLGLRREGLFSCSAQRASSRARHRGPPLVLGPEGLFAGSAQRASSQAL